MSRRLALIAGLALAAGTACFALPASAQVAVRVGVGIGVAPPPPRVERMPPPRAGYVWAPGYWRWDARWRRHVWVAGYWVRMHPGYHYRPATWVRGPHGRWHFHDGGWYR